ncbi:MAG: macrolide export ATP-binding/permease MacB [Candidatus Parabeggiatoa sp. nov. 1]|nr:MAG: macrolide export ATP-binding/permease MacB [Gammaproteobacteria bacterium]
MFLTYIREAFHNLYATKQRTLLALIGIVIGIGSVIAMVSVGIIAGEEALRRHLKLGTDMMGIEKPRRREEPNPKAQISLEAALALPQLFPSITTVAPYISTWGRYRFAGKGSYAAIIGATEAFFELHQLEIKEGRFISALDQKQPYVVMAQRVLTFEGFKDFKGPLLGSQVKINRHIYTIIGVLEDVPEPLFGLRGINWAFIMPMSTAQRYLENNNIRGITVRFQPDTDYTRVGQQVKQYFAQQVEGLEVQTRTADKLIELKEQEAQMYTLLLGAIGSISLFVGGIGIMNVMLTSVMERRREIGILRAIGARQRDIQWQFLAEAIILSLVGGAFGVGLGIGASYLVAWFNGWQFLISTLAILLGFGVSSGVGIFFGFFPAYKAAKLDPITALRSEM